VNDLVLNVAASGTPSVPLMWRAKGIGGIKNHNTWSAGGYYEAGILLRPGTPGDPLYLAQNYGTVGKAMPAFANVPGTTYTDGTPPDAVVWKWWGTFDDASIWESVIAELPTMETVNVAGGGTVPLTEQQSAHARLKFVGATANVIALVKPGAALGWCRSFWNDTDFIVTVKVTDLGKGVEIAARDDVHAAHNVRVLFADATDVRATT
jgi:hypothetical protein